MNRTDMAEIAAYKAIKQATAHQHGQTKVFAPKTQFARFASVDYDDKGVYTITRVHLGYPAHTVHTNDYSDAMMAVRDFLAFGTV